MRLRMVALLLVGALCLALAGIAAAQCTTDDDATAVRKSLLKAAKPVLARSTVTVWVRR